MKYLILALAASVAFAVEPVTDPSVESRNTALDTMQRVAMVAPNGVVTLTEAASGTLASTPARVGVVHHDEASSTRLRRYALTNAPNTHYHESGYMTKVRAWELRFPLPSPLRRPRGRTLARRAARLISCPRAPPPSTGRTAGPPHGPPAQVMDESGTNVEYTMELDLTDSLPMGVVKGTEGMHNAQMVIKITKQATGEIGFLVPMHLSLDENDPLCDSFYFYHAGEDGFVRTTDNGHMLFHEHGRAAWGQSGFFAGWAATYTDAMFTEVMERDGQSAITQYNLKSLRHGTASRAGRWVGSHIGGWIGSKAGGAVGKWAGREGGGAIGGLIGGAIGGPVGYEVGELAGGALGGWCVGSAAAVGGDPADAPLPPRAQGWWQDRIPLWRQMGKPRGWAHRLVRAGASSSGSAPPASSNRRHAGACEQRRSPGPAAIVRVPLVARTSRRLGRDCRCGCDGSMFILLACACA